MTFQYSEVTQKLDFDIITEDQKIYFSDYPDQPIFEKGIVPDDLWDLIEINFEKLFDDLLSDSKVISILYGLLKEENETEYCSDENVVGSIGVRLFRDIYGIC